MMVEKIERLLRETISASHVAVQDESDRHAGHPGAVSGGRHYRVTVVSPLFEGKAPVERHRIVYEALAAEMKAEIHALALRTIAPSEYKAA